VSLLKAIRQQLRVVIDRQDLDVPAVISNAIDETERIINEIISGKLVVCSDEVLGILELDGGTT
jgi:hypothetical protein